jgi:polyphosphate kinase
MSEKELYINRDLSWLEFNARVLHEAKDERTPLFERAKFLGIFQSNLDEYFMKRLGSLYSNARVRFREQLLPLLIELHTCFEKEVMPGFKKEGIDILLWKELTPEERERANQFYRSNIFPVLTPLAVDSGHPFPFVSNQSLSLGISLKYPDRDDEYQFARVKIPSHFVQWIRIDGHKDTKNHYRKPAHTFSRTRNFACDAVSGNA